MENSEIVELYFERSDRKIKEKAGEKPDKGKKKSKENQVLKKILF